MLYFCFDRLPRRGIVSETFVVEDCWRYDPTEYVGGTSANVVTKNWQLPTNYVITWEMYGGQSNTATDIQIGASNGSKLVCGYIQNATTYQVWSDNQAVKLNSQYSMPTNTWTEQELTVQNGVATYWDLTTTPTTVDLTNLALLVVLRSKIRNIKIKPL